MTRLLVAIDRTLPGEVAAAARQLATDSGEAVLLARIDADLLDDLRAWLLVKTQRAGVEELAPRTGASAAPMSAAPFLYRTDGRPDWAGMWGSFCELALYGGPPHRGEDNPVIAPAQAATETDELMAELRRGVLETTGLESRLAPEGWLAIACHDKRMAAWMCAAIILENVDARCEGATLYVPAGAGFELTNEVKSVITVVAKVNHYWQAHVAELEFRKA